MLLSRPPRALTRSALDNALAAGDLLRQAEDDRAELAPVGHPGGLAALSRQECLALLRSRSVGSGRARCVPEPEPAGLVLPTPWTQGPRRHVVRVRASRVTGRRTA